MLSRSLMSSFRFFFYRWWQVCVIPAFHGGTMSHKHVLLVQEGIESQAVDRVNRIGQKKAVHVYQLIAENTVESKVLEIQERKKQLIQQVWVAYPKLLIISQGSPF